MREIKLLDFYYKWSGDTDLIQIIERLGLEISWIIEAGCHDGKDTLRLANALHPQRLIAFEPDPAARRNAEKLFSEHNLSVELHDVALSNSNSVMYMNFPHGQMGSGSTFVSDQGVHPISVKRLESLDLRLDYGGLLWLDVEGHAVSVLQGGLDTWTNLVIAKIEVQMHDMHKNRTSDLFQVNRIMKSQGLVPIRGPLHPGFFGDVIYVNKKGISPRLFTWSILLDFQFSLLHKVVYPLLNKPKKV